MMRRKQFISLVFFFCSLTFCLQAQELCNNAIDDDGDGLIDLNDDDCICNTLLPSSLIPNPSFEEKTCCPMENERLDCAVDWIQASAPTTDYVHTCGGYMGNTSAGAIAPLPFPDGEGGVGFRDGQANVGPNFKEYVGACLNQKMEAGVNYRLEFFVGFRDNVIGSKDLDIALFGSTQCSQLPFGNGNFLIGCPLNTGNYSLLGENSVSGSNEWVSVVFEFVADQAYEVIVLGPSCPTNPNFTSDPYFYLDGLTLAESDAFGVPFESITGSICGDDLALAVAEEIGQTYQWYKDGVALVGETNASILLTSIAATEGTYTLVTNTSEGCFLSKDYELRIPPYYTDDFASICEEEFYYFGGDTLTAAGSYEALFAAADGCDSIVALTLDVTMTTYHEFQDTFCEGTTYLFEDIMASEEGIYQTTTLNEAGCDSVITVELQAVSLGIGAQLEETVSIELGHAIDLKPLFYDPSFTDFLWLDQSGNTLGEQVRIVQHQPVQSTIVYFEALNAYGCSVRDSMEIEVIPNHTLYVPNAFSPNGNGTNDFFRFYAPLALDKVYRFTVFNRWGGIVFQDSDIVNFGAYRGWDGNVDGSAAGLGVYCYLIHALFLDGTEKIIAGDVTLLR